MMCDMHIRRPVECNGADSDGIGHLEESLPGDSLSVDEGAVHTVVVANSNLSIVILYQFAVMARDLRIVEDNIIVL